MISCADGFSSDAVSTPHQKKNARQYLEAAFQSGSFGEANLIKWKIERQSIASTFMKILMRASRQSSNHRLPLFFHSIFAIACILVLLSFRPALADELSDARTLVSSGKHAEALVIADNYLGQKPNDAHMLFLKGLILTEQNQGAKAIAVFTRLTEEYPALPEPYNNLAVLYASAGQYDKARAALESAIRTNPSYATAYENLGDIYAKLASQAYDKALQTHSGSSAAKSKLALVHGLVTGTPGAKVPPTVIAAAPKPAPVPPVATPPAAHTPAASAPIAPPAVKAEPKPASKPAPKPDAGSNSDRDDIAKTLNDWAAAWSSKDVKKYLGYYASDFKTPRGMTRKAWSDERQARIVGKGRIIVKIERPQISISGNTATVKFHQAYSSDRLSVSSKKTMIFAKSGGKWKIQQELAN